MCVCEYRRAPWRQSDSVLPFPYLGVCYRGARVCALGAGRGRIMMYYDYNASDLRARDQSQAMGHADISLY